MKLQTLHWAAAASLFNEVSSFVTTSTTNSIRAHTAGSSPHKDALHALAKTFWADDADQYEIKFIDDFDGDTIDASKWTPNVEPGPGNGEQQLYTDSDENAFVKDSILHIRAIRKDPPVMYGDPPGPWSWTSARLETTQLFNFTFGRMSTRVRCEPVDGPFSAVWAVSEKINDPSIGWPKCGEIDFFEMQTLWDYTPSTLHFDEHHYGSAMSFFSSKTFKTVNEWHEYGVEWGDNYIAFYHDGERIGEYPRPVDQFITETNWPYSYDNPFYLIINNAMDPAWGTKADSTLMQHDLEVDWIKVEQKS